MSFLKKLSAVFISLALVCALGLGLYLIYLTYDYARFQLTAFKKTEGQVIYAKVWASKNASASGGVRSTTTTYYSLVEYSYRVNNKYYKGHEKVPHIFYYLAKRKFSKYPPHKVITVYYNAKHPDKSRLSRYANFSKMLALMFFPLMVFGSILWKIVSYLRERSMPKKASNSSGELDLEQKS